MVATVLMMGWVQDMVTRGLEGWRSGVLPRVRTRLRAKLILPYVLLTLLVAAIGIFVTLRLVTAKVNERFQNALAEAGRVAEDGFVAQEVVHLETLRQMAFTEGVAEALTQRDEARLRKLLMPLAVNRQVEAVAAIDSAGAVVVLIGPDPADDSVAWPADLDLAALDPVERVLQGESDSQGDKFAGILSANGEPFLFTVAPVTRDGERFGALLIATQLDSILERLFRQSLADLIVLAPDGRMIATTLAVPQAELPALQVSPVEAAAIDTRPTRSVSLASRDYEVLYSTLELRRRPIGILGIAFARDYVVATENVSRDTILAVFFLLMLAVSLLGVLIARALVRPILRLREVSQAVAAGDLGQRTGLALTDEIGDLAVAFDQMTLRLHERTQEAGRLHAETRQRNIELTDAYAKLQLAQRQLIQTEKLSAIGQLTAGLVHDVKRPLTRIKGLAELMGEMSTLEPTDRANMTQIVEQADRADRIVTDLIKFARQSDHELVPGDYCATVEAVVRLHAYLAREAGVEIEVEASRPSILGIFDQNQIEQLLANLIQNAIQAMPAGGRVRILIGQSDQTIILAVQDAGVGIPEEQLDRIFDPFFTTRQPGEGVGLGLSVSYGIVAGHDGTIEVASTVGVGTTVRVSLPVDPTRTVLVPSTAAPSLPDPSTGRPPHQPLAPNVEGEARPV